MSLVFSDTTLKLGLVQEMDSICNSNATSQSLDVKTRRLNGALDHYYYLAMLSDTPWQIDDKNFTDLPIATFNLVSGQRDYKITVDEDLNEVLKVHKVFVKISSTGDFKELDYTDEVDRNALQLLLNNSSQAQGIPDKYNWFGNSIFFDPAPSYSSTGGVKIIYQRTGSYFTATGNDTKKAGIPGIHHMYLARKASLPYLAEKGMKNFTNILKLVGSSNPSDPYYGGDELAIEQYFQSRSRDRNGYSMIAGGSRANHRGADSNK